MRRVIGYLAVVLIWATPAQAATITFGGTIVDDQGQFSTVAGATLVDFNALALGTQDFVAGIASYDDVNIFRCAACTGNGDLGDDTTNGASAGGGGSFAIDFSQPLSYFGLYWGSPDVGNALSLFDGAVLVRTVTGLEVGSVVGFGHPGGGYVNVFADAGERFTRAVFVGGTFPIETDNHAFVPVPEPVSLLLMTTAAVGLIARRRIVARPTSYIPAKK